MFKAREAVGSYITRKKKTDSFWKTRKVLFVKILTHLSPFAIVFVLASELVVFEALEDLGHPLGGVGQHGLQGHPGGESAVLGEGEHSCGEDHGDHLVIRRALAENFF